MMKKLVTAALAVALFTGANAFAANACACSGDDSPCKCAAGCPCKTK